MLRALIILTVLFATGAPIARLLRRTGAAWSSAIFEAIAIGLIAQILIGIVALRTGHYSPVGIGVMTLIVIIGGLVAGRWWRPSELPALDTDWLLLTLGLVVVALLVRQHPSYFVFETGDMGEYVNRANRVADGTNLLQSFPHGFTVFLASTKVLLGEAHTVAGLPVLGVVLLMGTVSLAKVIGLRIGAVLAVGVVIVLHPVTVWFSEFPVSEALYAALLISALYFLVRARRDQLQTYAIASGIAIGMMLLVRGNAMLLAPVLIVALLVSAIVDTGELYRVQRLATAVGLASLSAAYVYDIRFPSNYFVNKQLATQLPGFAFRFARRTKLLELSPVLIVALVLTIALVLVAAHGTRALAHTRLGPAAVPFLRMSSVALVALTCVVLVVIHHDGLVDALKRWDLVVLVLALGGAALVVSFPGRYLDGTTGFIVLLGIATYSVLYAARVSEARSHPYYLYFDRYLFSEVLPLALVLVAIALHALIEVFSREANPRVVRGVAVAGLVVLAAAFIPTTVQTWRITRHALFGDAYGTLQRIDTLAGPRGPIVYSGLFPVPRGWFYGNTYRVFAMPLSETFGRRIVGTDFKPNHRDPRFDPAEARAELARAGYTSGSLVALRPPEADRYPDDAHTRYVGTVHYDVPILNRSLDRSEERFHTVSIDVDVYALS